MIKRTTKNIRAHVHWAVAIIVPLVLLAIPLLPRTLGQPRGHTAKQTRQGVSAQKAFDVSSTAAVKGVARAPTRSGAVTSQLPYDVPVPGRIADHVPTQAPPAGPTPTPSCTPIVITGSIDNTDPTQVDRVVRTGAPTLCICNGSCSTTSAGAIHYDAYIFTNTSGSAQCVTVDVNTACAGNNFIFTVAYLDSFDPNNICANWIADEGVSPAPTQPFAFNIDAGQTFVLVVSEVTAGAGCPSYTMTVSGLCGGIVGPFRPPTGELDSTSARTAPVSSGNRTSLLPDDAAAFSQADEHQYLGRGAQQPGFDSANMAGKKRTENRQRAATGSQRSTRNSDKSRAGEQRPTLHSKETLSAAGGPTPTATPGCSPTVINGSIDSSDPTQVDRLFRSTIPGNCDYTFGCLVNGDGQPRHYDAYNFTNTTGSTQCVTVDMNTACADANFIFTAAYLGSFDPNNICANWMADEGESPHPQNQFSFTVDPDQDYVLVVSEVNVGAGCPAYTMTVTCEPYQPPPAICPPRITQSTSQAVVLFNSLACTDPGLGTLENHYWRAFDMNTFTGGQAYNITSVEFGIEQALSLFGTDQPLTVNLYTNHGAPFPDGDWRSNLLATSGEIRIPNQEGTIFNVPLTATVPAGTLELVMEVFSPDQTKEHNNFLIGSNPAPEIGFSYTSAPDCGHPEPVPWECVGFSGIHQVFNVNGSCEGGTPTPTPIPTPTPTATARPIPTPRPHPTPRTRPTPPGP